MTQKALTVVIDEFEAAIAALALHAPQEARTRLNKATGDLLEALSTAAQDQASSAALMVFETMETITSRMKEDEASQAHVNAMIINLEEGVQAEQGKQAARLGIVEAAQTTAAHDLKEHIEQDRTE